MDLNFRDVRIGHIQAPQNEGSFAKDSRFPWGRNRPTHAQRLLVAAIIATAAIGITLSQYAQNSGFRSDFGIVWFGARSLLDGIDPYPLVGPGLLYDWGWPLLYPATALVAGIPLAGLSEQQAAVTFVWLSTFALAYGATSDSWHRVPLFASEAFVASAKLAQWSILLSAALFIPALAAFVAVKPHTGLSIVATTPFRRAIVAAFVGSAILLTVSLIALPTWPFEWLALLKTADHMRPPVTRLGGVFILLVLLRWRRPEAWLVFTMACLPQGWGWYGTLLLLTIPCTFREACTLAIVTSAGSLLGPYLIGEVESLDAFHRAVGAIMVASVYLPVTLLVMRRPNSGPSPLWLVFALRVVRTFRWPHGPR